MGSYRISQLAERCGVPASTLRFYESAGLLPAERTTAGYRLYGEEAVRRLEFITSAKHLGLPLLEIRELLRAWQEGECSSVRSHLLPMVGTRIEEARARVAELTALSAQLSDIQEQLSGPAPAGACGPGCGCVTATAPPGRRVTHIQRRKPAPPPAEDHPEEAWRSQPVACGLDGPAMSGRVQDWQRLLVSATGREPIPGGLRLTFPTDPALAQQVTELALAEQECCAFYDFTLHLGPGALVLTVRAPEAGARLLADLFGTGV